MNIFYLDHDQTTCAQYHVDKHITKMTVELAQLLSTAHHVINPDAPYAPNIYKLTHKNHPSAVWARASRQNYDWLYTMLRALSTEYTYRYGKIHATTRLFPYLKNAPDSLESKPFTEPTLAMPDEYRIDGDAIQSYRNYYNGGKRELFAWKNRPVPHFIK